MQSYRHLLTKWQQIGLGELTNRPYAIRLSTKDQHKLDQLCQRFPRLSKDEIIRDLLSTALRDLEASLPYQPGNKVIALDEWGDEIYEDCGLTPKLLKLTKEHQAELRRQSHG